MIQKVISAQQEVIDMQDRIYKLQVENNELKEKLNKTNNVERYRGVPVITLKNDAPKIMYCANCYGNEGKLIQLQLYSDNHCYCSVCKNQFNINNSIDCQKLKESLK